MNIEELNTIIKSLGWITSKDDVGDRVALYNLTDRVVHIIYDFKRVGPMERMNAMVSISTDEYSKICYRVGRGYKYTPLVVLANGLQVEENPLTEKAIEKLSCNAIDWAKNQDLMLALKECASLPTNSVGNRPIRHLAALALMEDKNTLQFYQKSFEEGERLGFVPYITKDYIDRALKFSVEHAKRP